MKEGICKHLLSKNHILLLTHILMNKINLFVLKYGSSIHTLLFIFILYVANIYPNSLIYWVFLINHIMFSYFLFIRGMALGISKTIDIIALEKATKAIQEDINKNN